MSQLLGLNLSRYTYIGAALGLLIMVTSLILGAMYTFSQPVAYEDTATIWVQPKLAEMVPSSYQSSLYAPLTAFFNSPISTAGEVLKSEVVLKEAILDLQKQLPKEACPDIGALRGGVTVNPVSNTDILVIRFRYSEPKVCKLALNTLLDAFIRVNSTQSAQSAIQSRIFLEKQDKQAQIDSLNARQAVKKFEQENKTVDLGDTTSRILSEMGSLDMAVKTSQTAIAQMRSRIEYLQGQLKIRPEQAMISERLSIDDVVKELGKKIAQDEVKLIEWQSRLKEEHPRLQQLKITIADSKKAMKARIRDLVGEVGLDPGMQIYTEDPVQQKLLTEMVDAQANELSEETKITSYQEQMAALQDTLNSVPEKQLQLAELKRAADVASNILTDTERNLHSVRLLESVASKASNIQILDRPGEPSATERKTSVGLMMSGALGFVLGVAVFLGVYFLNPSVQRIREVMGLVPLPIVGWINKETEPGSAHDVLPGLQHLRANLRSWLAPGHTCIVVSSGDPEDGKTILASGLALSLSQSGISVLLVGMNFNHRNIHEVFGVPNAPGLADFFKNQSTAAELIRPIRQNLDLVTAGAAPIQGTTLESANFRRLLELWRQQYDAVILDSSSISDSADTLAVLNSSAYLLVVVRMQHTYRESLRLLSAQLKQQEIAGGGLVFFNVDERAVISALSSQMPAEEPMMSVASGPQTEGGRW